ncbi:hypothetical protein FN846DRAFT_980848, partial [Sphaerosporella brunnea]
MYLGLTAYVLGVEGSAVLLLLSSRMGLRMCMPNTLTLTFHLPSPLQVRVSCMSSLLPSAQPQLIPRNNLENSDDGRGGYIPRGVFF